MVLSTKAQFLYWLAKEAPAGRSGKKEVRLEGVDATLFKILIDFVYTKEVPTDIEHPKAMFCLADRFEVFGMRVAMEIYLTNTLSKANAIDLAVFGEAHSCALLLEEAVDFIVTYAKELKEVSPTA